MGDVALLGHIDDTDRKGLGQMARVGYRRVSTEDQHLENQGLGTCDKVFEDKASGATKDRPGLKAMLEYVREGDEVVVLAIDRMARSTKDLIEIVETLHGQGVGVTFLRDKVSLKAGAEASPTDELLVTMLSAIGQFERKIMLARQKSGIERAKTEGKYLGGVKRLDRERVAQMLKENLPRAEIARRLGMSRSSVYRIIEELAPLRDFGTEQNEKA